MVGLVYTGTPELEAAMVEFATRHWMPEEQTIAKAQSSRCSRGFDLHIYPVGGRAEQQRTAWSWGLAVACLTPRSRGVLKLTSRNPAAAPLLDHGYLSDPDGDDERVLVDGIHIARELGAAPRLAALLGEEKWPGGKGVWDEKQLEKIIKHFVWRSDPEDLTGPLVPLFSADRTASGRIGRLSLSISDRMLVIMPRGVSKTTLLNAHNIREILHHEISFLVYLSETVTHAEQQLENIKRALETNPLIQAVYGAKRPERSSVERWTQSLIETTDGVVIAAKGRG